MPTPSLVVACLLLAAPTQTGTAAADRAVTAPVEAAPPEAPPPAVAPAPVAPPAPSGDPLKDRVEHVVPSAPDLEIARGDTVFVDVELPLRKPPTGELDARLGDPVKGKGSVALVQWIDSVEITKSEDPKLAAKPVARARYAIRASATAGGEVVKLGGQIDLREKGSNAVIATTRFVHTVRVTAPSITLEEIERDKQAYAAYQDLAKKAYLQLTGLRDVLHLDRVDPLPDARRIEATGRSNVETYFRNRLRADIAKEHLRAAVELDDPGLATRALSAYAVVSKDLESQPGRPAPVLSKTPRQTLDRARTALAALSIGEAQGLLERLRKTGKLTAGELAETLRLLGGIFAVQGDEEAATNAFGQALCVNPNLESPMARGAIAGLFGRVKESNKCPQAMAFGLATATRVPSPDETVIVRVKVPYGPDPYDLVQGGDIELWGSGGAIIEARKVTAQKRGIQYLSADFVDNGFLENYNRQLLVRVIARDSAGVPVLELGVPDPAPIAIDSSLELQEQSATPWWLWAVGGVAVIGAATTALVLITGKSDPARGIGPIHTEF